MQHPSVHVAQHKHAHHTILSRRTYSCTVHTLHSLALGHEVLHKLGWGTVSTRAPSTVQSAPVAQVLYSTLSDKVLFTLYCTHTRARHDQLQHTVFDMTYGHCLAGPCLENLEDSHASMR